ncbi:MAG TPA: hypothetical protein VIV40_06340 [Kofleriaceae bacterium]
MDDAGFAKPQSIDAAPGIDSPPGSGSYGFVDTTAPYVGLGDLPVIDGFVAGADDDNYTVALPFAFDFYRVRYDQLTVSVDGYVTFTTPATGLQASQNDCPFDGTLPDAVIALFWDDLFASAMVSPKGTIVTATGGSAPNRTFTVEWRDMDAWYAQGGSFWSQTMRTTQQLVLHEDGVIELHYGPRTGGTKDRDCGVDRHLGCSATIGLEGAGGAPVHLVQCGTELGPMTGFTPVAEGRLFQFTPQ